MLQISHVVMYLTFIYIIKVRYNYMYIYLTFNKKRCSGGVGRRLRVGALRTKMCDLEVLREARTQWSLLEQRCATWRC